MGSKLHTGSALTKNEIEEAGLDLDIDEDDDSDYEYQGGDSNMYESRLEEVDELETLRDTLNFVA